MKIILFANDTQYRVYFRKTESYSFPKVKEVLLNRKKINSLRRSKKYCLLTHVVVNL